MIKINKEKFVYADLNGLEGDFLPWTTTREIDRLKSIHPELREGLKVLLWTDDADEKGKYDPLVYEGTYTFDSTSVSVAPTPPCDRR